VGMRKRAVALSRDTPPCRDETASRMGHSGLCGYGRRTGDSRFARCARNDNKKGNGNGNGNGKGKSEKRKAKSKSEKQKQKQIPCGNDRKKG